MDKKSQSEYRHLCNVITYGLGAIILLINVIYSICIVKMGHYHGQLVARGIFLLLVFPAVRIFAKMALNLVATLRGDDKPFEKDKIW